MSISLIVILAVIVIGIAVITGRRATTTDYTDSPDENTGAGDSESSSEGGGDSAND